MRSIRGGVLFNPDGSVVDGVTDENAIVTNAPGAALTVNADKSTVAIFTGLAAAITGVTVTGTPSSGQSLQISLTDNGTARAITWGSQFEASTVALPTTTVINARLDVYFTWNAATSKWRCVRVA